MLAVAYPRFFERASDRDLFERQILRPIGHEQLRILRHQAGNPIGDVQPRRIFAGEQRRARGRADRAGRVGLREFHAVLRELVDVRRLVQIAAVAGEVGPAEVVDQNQHDVRLRRRVVRRLGERR